MEKKARPQTHGHARVPSQSACGGEEEPQEAGGMITHHTMGHGRWQSPFDRFNTTEYELDRDIVIRDT